MSRPHCLTTERQTVRLSNMSPQQIAEMDRPQVLAALRALHAQPPHSQLAMIVARQQAMKALVQRLAALPVDPDDAAILADKRAAAQALIAVMDASPNAPVYGWKW